MTVPASSEPEEAARQRADFARHKYLFAFGLFATLLLGLVMRLAPQPGPLALIALSLCGILGGACGMASGAYAIRARRHMFSVTQRMSNGMAFAKASALGSKSVWVVAALLIGFGVMLVLGMAIRVAHVLASGPSTPFVQ